MFSLDDALEIARRYHGGQVDKAGEPYIGHIERVVGYLKEDQREEEILCIAALHDIVEDSGVSAEMLRGMGVPEEVIEAVLLLSRNVESGGDYYGRIKNNEKARLVKMADIKDNMNEARLARLDETTQKKLREKYSKAIALLKGL